MVIKPLYIKNLLQVFCLITGTLAIQNWVYAADSEHGTMDHSTMDHDSMDQNKDNHHDHENHQSHDSHSAHDGHEDHSKHMAMMKNTSKISKSTKTYRIPDLTLINKSGEKVSVVEELTPDKPVLLNFIFTTCTTICPVMSATFSQAQKLLGAEISNVRMVSISIDPEQDTPEKLREYATKFNANPEWHFLTGSTPDIISVLQAFDSYRGNKMNHEPVTLLRKSKNDPWLRIDGLTTAQELVDEYRHLTNS